MLARQSKDLQTTIYLLKDNMQIEFDILKEKIPNTLVGYLKDEAMDKATWKQDQELMEVEENMYNVQHGKISK